MVERDRPSGWEIAAVFVSIAAILVSIYTYVDLKRVANDNRVQDLNSAYLSFSSNLIKETRQGDACARNGLGGPATSQDCQYGMRTAEAIYLLKPNEPYWIQRVIEIVEENADAKVNCSMYSPRFTLFLESELNRQCEKSGE